MYRFLKNVEFILKVYFPIEVEGPLTLQLSKFRQNHGILELLSLSTNIFIILSFWVFELLVGRSPQKVNVEMEVSVWGICQEVLLGTSPVKDRARKQNLAEKKIELWFNMIKGLGAVLVLHCSELVKGGLSMLISTWVWKTSYQSLMWGIFIQVRESQSKTLSWRLFSGIIPCSWGNKSFIPEGASGWYLTTCTAMTNVILHKSVYIQ